MSIMRRLDAAELEGVYAIDVTECGDMVYSMAAGRLAAVRDEWQRPERTIARWDAMIAEWRVILADGGAAWGAFVREQLVGIAVMRERLTDDTAQLAALFVSRPYRRRGIAGRLVQEVLSAARSSGVRQLYVSATPSQSAVGFYQSLGFALAEHAHPELFAREPDDIHMVLALSP